MAILSKVISSNQQASIFILLKLVFTKYKRVCSALVNRVYSIRPKVTQPASPNKKLKIHKDPYRFSSEYGFTLVELIVTVAILAIVATIAAPSIVTQLANMEAKRIRFDIKNTLAIAKAESFIQHRNVLACLSDTNGVCHRDSDKTLLLFIDNNDNNNFDANIDALLETQSLDPKYATLHLRAGNRSYVRFAGDSGKPRGFFGHIKYCPNVSYNQKMYQISFNQSGIIKYKPNSIHDTGCKE
ncbi:Tfp pilus assembly protein FimT/FimU [Psychrobacter sp. LV10R520-6]|uniref:pilus assembly FimT family protein n=1 Tax=Psychrobacter sp. LV10R520-6 TaxID=1415574 RepID=UPI0024C533E5|nr:GspH/FimT family pseudopilin [Psychrobacter sp. LV10R520-6]SNT68985.1 type IV fimbrial biogenesis protein FimT [Psychrobacter sp. LV10R520-6]